MVENLRAPGSKENAEGKNLCVLNNFFFLLKNGGNAERKNLFVPRLIICFLLVQKIGTMKRERVPTGLSLPFEKMKKSK